MFRALANVSLSSLSSPLIDNMSEGDAASPTTTICILLEYLPRIIFMRLCRSDFALEVTQRLRDDLELCPELRELEAVGLGGRREGLSVYLRGVRNAARK